MHKFHCFFREDDVSNRSRCDLAARVQEAKSNYVHGLTKSGGLKELMEDMESD